VIATSSINSPRSVQLYEKTLSNIKEVKARDGIVISLVTPFNKEAIEASDYYVEIPPTNEFLLPILEIVPLQLLAYYIAVRRGCDVDQPRNLAKSVTVE
jgi:glucosamine--fructose-6-phosphate aminotransferase (isomerizing)